jgi:hypothetical protein
MNDTDNTALMLETLAELAPEIRSAHADPQRALPNLREVLRKLSPLPQSALFLGVANDGLPVLLNLDDPVPGPVLIAGDSGSGKTRLLQVITQAVAASHDLDSLRYAVISSKPQEWERYEQSANCEGILPFQQPMTANYLGSLVEWAHSNKHGEPFVVLLIDGLDALNTDTDLQEAVRWLLLRGPSRRIWPIVTLATEHLATSASWLAAFRTRLCGHVAAGRDVTLLTGATDFAFSDLLAGSQIAMREGKDWLPFWLPRID